jgi:hypothetical protein
MQMIALRNGFDDETMRVLVSDKLAASGECCMKQYRHQQQLAQIASQESDTALQSMSDNRVPSSYHRN